MVRVSSSLPATAFVSIVTITVSSALPFSSKSKFLGILHEYPQEAPQPYPILSFAVSGYGEEMTLPPLVSRDALVMLSINFMFSLMYIFE